MTERLILDGLIITTQATGTSSFCYPVPPRDPFDTIGQRPRPALPRV
ncbi:MAG: hypothetical protein WA447_01885 [Candidatus Binatus sp.]